jgi:ParB family transcriptional regulator, chromosome partitioning protein
VTEEGRRLKLGRGLSALFAEDAETAAGDVAQTKMLPIDLIRPGRMQPRKRFDEEGLQALVESIRQKGVLQPLLVRRQKEGSSTYEIIAGERRWRAAQLAQLHEIPVFIKELGDREALEIALIENIQRQDLTPLEEAEGYRRLMEEFSHTQEDLAKAVGKSRSHVANTMRLLGLPDSVKSLLNDGRLTAGHARTLLTAADPAALADEIVERGLTVRQAEALASREKTPRSKPASTSPPQKDPDTLALERELGHTLGLKVTLTSTGGGGTLAIHYRTLEQLDDLLRRLNEPPMGRAFGG